MISKTTYVLEIDSFFKSVCAINARTAVLKFLGKSPKSVCYNVTINDEFVTATYYTATVTKTSKYGTVLIGVVTVYEGNMGGQD